MSVHVYDGLIKNSGGTVVSGAYYQAYFYKVNSGSSNSIWGTVKQSEASGYYSVTVQSGDLVGVGGTAGAGDQLIICAWVGEATRLGTAKTAYICTVLTLGAAGAVTGDLRMRANTAPTTIATGPATIRNQATYTLTNTSHDDMSWAEVSPYHVLQQQRRIYGPATIFDACGLDYVDVTWGDTTTSQLAGPTYANGSHVYTETAGTPRTITARALDLQATQGNLVSFNITVLARVPVNGLGWLPASPTISDLLTFTPSITDSDNRITSVDYSVNGGTSYAYTGLTKTATWQHTFTSSGTKTVRQRINWHDGVSAQTQEQNYTVIVDPVAVHAAPTTANVTASSYTWVSTSATDSSIISHTWLLEKNTGSWVTVGTAVGAGFTSFTYTFSEEGDYRLTLTVANSTKTSAPIVTTFTVNIVPAGFGGGFKINKQHGTLRALNEKV